MASTEKEKMLAGQLYIATDPELVKARQNARALTRKYNQTLETQPEERVAILKQLFGKVGPKVEIEPPFLCDYGAFIEAGNNLYMNFGCTILDVCKVTIGDNVLFGPHVQVYTPLHPLDAVERNSGKEFGAPVTIGNNVWIGGGAIICAGVTIGDNTTIGAGSVVVKDIPAHVFAAGNPCKVIRFLDKTKHTFEV